MTTMLRTVAILIAILFAGAARADFTFTQGSGATAFSVTSGTGNCNGVHCFASVPIDTAGAQLFSASNAGRVSGTGTAGTAATGVITVQGIASMTPMLANPGTAANWGVGATGAAVPANAVALGVTDSGTLRLAPGDATNGLWVNIKNATGLAAGSTTSGQTGSIVMCATTTGAPSNTTAQTNFVSCDLAGNTRVAATPYPSGAVPYTASTTGTTGATTATLAGASSVTTYICGFSIRANATAAATGNATVTGTISGTLNFTQWTAPLASGLGISEMIFAPCVPASATNTSIAVVSAAPGSGGVVSVTAWGYKL